MKLANKKYVIFNEERIVVDSLNFQNVIAADCHGNILAAYNTVVYQLKRAFQTGNEECQKRFQEKKTILEAQISECGVYNDLAGHLKDCFGVDDISSIPMPDQYLSKDEMYELIVEEESSPSLYKICTRQVNQGYGVSDPTSGKGCIHDATLEEDDKCFIFCYD